MKSGGILLVDNVLWGAQVLAPKDTKSNALDAFNKHIKDDNSVNQLLLPIQDGCTIVRKKTLYIILNVVWACCYDK